MRSDTSVFECNGVEVVRAVLDITIENAVDNGQIDSGIRPSQQTTDFSFGMQGAIVNASEDFNGGTFAMTDNASDIVVGLGNVICYISAYAAVFNGIGAAPCETDQSATMVLSGSDAACNCKILNRGATDVMERCRTLLHAFNVHIERMALTVENACEGGTIGAYHIAAAYCNTVCVEFNNSKVAGIGSKEVPVFL